MVLKMDPWNEGPGLCGQRFDRLDDPQFVEGRRPQAADQAPGFVDGGPQQPQALAELLLDNVSEGAVTRGMLERLQVHHGPGEILGEPVVDFVRDKLPLAFLDLQQLPEHVPFVAEGLLRRG